MMIMTKCAMSRTLFPFDSSESVDTDGDGVGNNNDNDDDNDGIVDADDDFPLDPIDSAEGERLLRKVEDLLIFYIFYFLF